MSLSDLRRRLGERLGELAGVVESLDTVRPHLAASLYRHRIRCGYPRCRCADGPGHLRWCLSFTSPKGRHTRTLSAQELRLAEPAATAYRRYRRRRAEAARLAREIFALIDRIGKVLKRSVDRTLKKRRR